MSTNNISRYYKAIAYLEGLVNLPLSGDYMRDRSDPSRYLKRMRYFLDQIGNPDRQLEFVHITGTAGKGSVTTMVHEMLHAHGERVGSFTSPSVTVSIEKIRVGELYIAPSELADIVDKLKPVIDAAHQEGPFGRPSYYEIFFAIALVYFVQKKCTKVVLEVGLGGRYDMTNVIERPRITVITSVDYDHVELLGPTLRDIARDKAGIIKTGSVFLTTENRPQLLKIFRDICREKRVEMVVCPVTGDHRARNCVLATEIGHRLGIPPTHINAGLRKARLPCRFEYVLRQPLVILDGAHNRAKARSTVENLRTCTYRKLHVVIGMAANKRHLDLLAEIVPWADSLTFTRFESTDRQCADPVILMRRARRYAKKGVSSVMFLDPHQALDHVLKNAQKADAVLVVGSFFLAGELRTRWHSAEEVLLRRGSW